jgi:hypothetical protein
MFFGNSVEFFPNAEAVRQAGRPLGAARPPGWICASPWSHQSWCMWARFWQDLTKSGAQRTKSGASVVWIV